jgi:hypothetical protein
MSSRLLLLGFFAAFIGLSRPMPVFASDPDLSTPESTIAAYIDGVTRQDLNAVFAASSGEYASKAFNFVAAIGRMGALTPRTPLPSSSAFFIEINKADLSAKIASQVKFLSYGLMTTSELLNGSVVRMDASGAEQLASVLRADRLADLRLVKIGIPNPRLFNKEAYQASLAKSAKSDGADAATERVALIRFEGLNFVLGFTLLRYGNDWTISSQSSAISGFDVMGVPKRVTPEEFEVMIQ